MRRIFRRKRAALLALHILTVGALAAPVNKVEGALRRMEQEARRLRTENDGLRTKLAADTADALQTIDAHKAAIDDLERRLQVVGPGAAEGNTPAGDPWFRGQAATPPGGVRQQPAAPVRTRMIETFELDGTPQSSARDPRNGAELVADAVAKPVSAWLPAGAHAEAVVLAGVDASAGVSSQGDPRPVLLRITGPAWTAAEDGTALQVDIDGCTVTRNTSSVDRSKTGSQSKTSRPATLIRSLRRHGAFLARAGLSSRRMPRQFTSRPPKRGLSLRNRRNSRSIGVLLKSAVHQRALLEGHMPRSSTRSSRVLPDETGAMMSGTPAGSVASIWGTMPSHSTSPSGAWTATSWWRGTMRESRIVIVCESLPPECETATRAPARLICLHSGGTRMSAIRLDMDRSPRRWRERPLRGPRIRPAEAGHCLLPAPRGRGVERRAMGRWVRRKRVATAYGAFRASGRGRKLASGARPPPGRAWPSWVAIAVVGTAMRNLRGGLRRDRRKGTGGAAWAMVARRGAGMLTAGRERPAATTGNEAKLVYGGIRGSRCPEPGDVPSGDGGTARRHGGR